MYSIGAVLAEVAPEDWDAPGAAGAPTCTTRAGSWPHRRRWRGASRCSCAGEGALLPRARARRPVDAVTPTATAGRSCRAGRRTCAGAYAAWCRARGVLSTFAVFTRCCRSRRRASASPRSAGPSPGRSRATSRPGCTPTTGGWSAARGRARWRRRPRRRPATSTPSSPSTRGRCGARARRRSTSSAPPTGRRCCATSRSCASTWRARTGCAASVLGMGRPPCCTTTSAANTDAGRRRGAQPARAARARASGGRSTASRRCTWAAASAAARTRCSSTSAGSRPAGSCRRRSARPSTTSGPTSRAAGRPSTGTASSRPTASRAVRERGSTDPARQREPQLAPALLEHAAGG